MRDLWALGSGERAGFSIHRMTRRLEFLAGGATVRVHTDSPFYDRYLWDLDHAFTFTLAEDPPVGGWQASR